MIAVREAFYAIQGEGSRTGEASVFIRMAGCNLNCHFCDTDWQYGDKFDPEEVVEMVKAVSHPFTPRWVVLTGGEPCVAPDFDVLVNKLLERRYAVSVETNGTRWRDALGDCHVVVSPKGKWEKDGGLDEKLGRLDQASKIWPRELKLVVEADDADADIQTRLVRVPFIPTHLFVQPRYDDRRAWERAFQFVKAHPQVRLSLQTHKWLGCR